MTQTKQATSFPLLVRFILALVFLSLYDARAQCGSEGDPIVNITFGTSAAPDFGGGTTTYRHIPLGQTAQGEGWYRLVTNINLGLSSWQNLSDHTDGDTDGLMLVVNADDDPGEFYRIRVRGLCENTRFRFSAWIANANRPTECDGNPIPPNVRFVIEDMDGNIVSPPYQTENIAPSTTPQWLPYGFEFDTGDQTEFDLVLINDNPGGCGNDLAIDDIQFRPCGPVIELIPQQGVRQVDTLFFCEGDMSPMTINAEVLPGGGYTADAVFQWQTRSDNQPEWEDIPGENSDELTIQPTHGGWYRLSAAASTDNLNNRLCRIVSNSIRIAQTIPQTDLADVIEMGTICEVNSLLLDPPEYSGEGAGPLNYQWQSSYENSPFTNITDADANNYTFQSTYPGTYRFKRQAINSCGDRFTTHTYEVLVQETLRTTFDLPLPQQTLCLDDAPLLLTGGQIVNGNGAVEGVYRGNGVSNGYFHPSMAGLGDHVITFSPPAGTLCGEPSQAVITVVDTVYLDPMADMVILSGQTVTLQPQTNATSFSWSGQPGLDNYQTRNPNASPSETTTYTLTAHNAAGCEKTGSVTVTVLQDLTIPNAFTPNGDGANDFWEIEGLDDYPNARVQVFNRWGNLVFSSNGYQVPWDGQFNGSLLPAGTYYYTISSDVLERPLSGSISILR